jgi:hypothetical protein
MGYTAIARLFELHGLTLTNFDPTLFTCSSVAKAFYESIKPIILEPEVTVLQVKDVADPALIVRTREVSPTAAPPSSTEILKLQDEYVGLIPNDLVQKARKKLPNICVTVYKYRSGRIEPLFRSRPRAST